VCMLWYNTFIKHVRSNGELTDLSGGSGVVGGGPLPPGGGGGGGGGAPPAPPDGHSRFGTTMGPRIGTRSRPLPPPPPAPTAAAPPALGPPGDAEARIGGLAAAARAGVPSQARMAAADLLERGAAAVAAKSPGARARGQDDSLSACRRQEADFNVTGMSTHERSIITWCALKRHEKTGQAGRWRSIVGQRGGEGRTPGTVP
jgi:hypothetical protein